jgi:hypothetical protein
MLLYIHRFDVCKIKQTRTIKHVCHAKDISRHVLKNDVDNLPDSFEIYRRTVACAEVPFASDADADAAPAEAEAEAEEEAETGVCEAADERCLGCVNCRIHGCFDTFSSFIRRAWSLTNNLRIHTHIHVGYG